MNIFASITPILAAAANVATNAATTTAAAKPAMTINAPNGFDAVLAAFLIVGLIRGRKRGMSEELLDLIKWVLVVALGGLGYEPLGSFMAGSTMFSRLSCYVAMYALVVIALVLFFAFVRRHIGGKLIGSDVFGLSTFYVAALHHVNQLAVAQQRNRRR